MELAQGDTANKWWSQDSNQGGLPPEPMPLPKMLMLTSPLAASVMRCVMRYITLQLYFKSLMYGGGEEEEVRCFIPNKFSINISDQGRNGGMNIESQMAETKMRFRENLIQFSHVPRDEIKAQRRGDTDGG